MALSVLPAEHASFPPHPGLSKALGAYYTDERIARFLLQWTVVSGSDSVLDPACGSGVFLSAAQERISELGGDPSHQIWGIEIDETAYRSFAGSLRPSSGPQLLNANFFEIQPARLPPFSAVVGNPPFIRYQRFNGAMREAALRRAQEAGVKVSRLTSSWAPFLIHATRFLRTGGRLGMVAPAEIAYATYARPVLEHLRRSFRTINILGFARRLFPQLSEDTVLILAEGMGEPFFKLEFAELEDVDSLAEVSSSLPEGVALDPETFAQGAARLPQYLISPRIRDLYSELAAASDVTRLGAFASVGIGYVTGDNDFFHLDRETAEAYDIPREALHPAVRTGGDFDGLHFTLRDWDRLHATGKANLLLQLDSVRPERVSRYLAEGVRRGVPQRFKCRVREPWYRVPHVYVGDAFVTVMNGHRAKFAVNLARAVAPNTLHVARFRPGSEVGVEAAAVAWRTSLAALSCELEGHALGGGLLKLEPTEARRVLLPLPDLGRPAFEGLANELDGLDRSGEHEVARARADQSILREGLGLSETDIQDIQLAWRTLRDRRITR